MTLLYPLGLLGLLSLIALLIIYIIKPNFQQKRVSSTHIWRLSLKYRKKRIPINKLRNILLIICQVCILISSAIILSQPNKVLVANVDQDEVIAIIDSSASMRTKIEDETRYERAIHAVLRDFDSMPQNGFMSVLIADNNPHFLIERVPVAEKTTIQAKLQELLDDEMSCSFGTANVEAALALCEPMIQSNPSLKVSLYTDTTYVYVPNKINVVDVRESQEWNAGILNARAEFEEGYYAFYVEVACYGRDSEIVIDLEVQDANAYDSASTGTLISFQYSVFCSQDTPRTVIFKYFSDEDPPMVDDDSPIVYHEIDMLERVFSYQSIHISLQVQDSFADDDNFDIYGGQKEILKIQYASNQPGTFFNAFFYYISNYYADRWDIQVKEVRGTGFAVEGFDFYVFEHVMPATMPTDGVVMLVDPSSVPVGAGFTLGTEVDVSRTTNYIYLAEDEMHPISKNLIADKILVSKYKPIIAPESSYVPLMSGNSSTLLMVKDEELSKVVVMSFSLNFSNLPILSEFPLLMLNIFDYFLPPMVRGNAFEVYDSIEMRARGNTIDVSYLEIAQTYTTFPAAFVASIPGTYNLQQQLPFSDKIISESIYVKIPALESNIWRVEDGLSDPYRSLVPIDYYEDLLLFIAAALVAILFIEWLLHVHEES